MVIIVKIKKEMGDNMEANITINNQSTAQQPTNSYFDGGLLQFVGWSILGWLVTVLSLGLFYPWAAVMIMNWKAKHTVIEGKRLRFDGTAMQLFGNYIKWWLLTVITLGIYSFWLFIAMEKWKVKHTYFE